MKDKQKYTATRFSHLTSYAGVGSIVRGTEDRLMSVVDTRYWTDQEGNNTCLPIPYVNRITQALGIAQELRMPPIAREDSNKGIEGSYLPAVLFPTYAHCVKCGLLHPDPWRHKNKKLDEKVYCQEQKSSCNGILKQVVWCCITSDGYLDDVPWHAICHSKFNNKCEPDYQANYLKFFTGADGKKYIKCTKCKAGHVYEKRQLGFINKQQPWIYDSLILKDEEKVTATIVEVNDSSVYLPQRVNALVIPPESRISKTTVVDRLYNNSTALRDLDKLSRLRLKSGLKKLATKYKCSIENIKDAMKQINTGYPNFGTFETQGDLVVDEYQAFLTPLIDVKDDEDFVTEHKTSEWKKISVDEENLSAIINIVDRHIIAKRLREILIFKGFKRGFPSEDKGQPLMQPLIPPDIVGESSWLPAIELFGEGIFFTLDETIVSKWEKILAVKKRVSEIADRYEQSSLNLGDDVIISARFILLHTLAHLIIRELEVSSGFPAASLSERIYHSCDKKMAGILIYATVADVVGSLGGIVESTQPKEFLRLLNNAFKKALWCSLDPVCTEHQGQGPGWLNRAACHGCVLVPETACDYSNVFLDRVFIKGSEELGIPNFLEFITGNNNG